MALTARQARQQQIARDRAAMRAIAEDYRAVWLAVRADLDELNDQIAEAQAAGRTVSPSWLYRQDRYKALLAGIQSRVSQFNTTVAQRVYNEMLRAHSDGGNDAMALLRASLPDGVSFAFTHPPLAAFEQLSRQTLGKLFAGIDRDVAAKVRKALLQGIARGQAPAVIARSVRDALGMPLWKALRISRTEILGAYRSASSATYKANADVLDGWRWIASATACDFCAGNDGKVFSVDEDMASMVHPNCRCSAAPVTKSWADILSPLGVDVAQFPALAG